ncbi:MULTISPECIES: LacI family DNA-binding transcriptional regulator [Streptomyces]|uniref:LacI family transcriptional regulator n=1 Tax=Streptomyces harbinensis TaxID=1176198 RepID=A0A1I6VNU5_9ACTN|nr:MULTISPECIES: LacI family DNA-binding transcriptional regulator [Streptomyces]QKV71812.1 LacI family DNA-binding transcriptional regulator [Streptomyces harbinensis]SFT15376.1 LacI family transcriptional regulator [Streptomyces harbinensis]
MARTPTSRSSSGKAGGVTLAMVARRAGVSPQTVSNAINAPELLRPETLERVRAAIDAMGYRPHRAAQTLRTRSSRLIGYGVQSVDVDRTTPVMDRFLHALTHTAEEAGHRILLFAVPAGSRLLAPYQELVDDYSVDGFVLSDTDRGDRRQAWLAKHHIPFTAFGRMWSDKQIGDWVDVDGAAGIGRAVDHLAERGHRKVAFLGWPRGSGAGDDRAEGWKAALRRHGLPVRGLRAESVDDVDAARTVALRLLDTGADAIVCASDTLAMGAYRALRERGLTPGDDVAVTGFDDSPAAALVSPGLTTLAQPMDVIGAECVRLLLARIAEPDREPEHILLEPRLAVRESSAPPRPLM